MRGPLGIRPVCKACQAGSPGLLIASRRIHSQWEFRYTAAHRPWQPASAHQVEEHISPAADLRPCRATKESHRSRADGRGALVREIVTRRRIDIGRGRDYHTSSSRTQRSFQAQYTADTDSVNTVKSDPARPATRPGYKRAFIALGGNLGDRVAEIETACRRLDETPDIKILRTSGLWETDPMYVENQAKFLNGVCEIETILSPTKLLDRLQHVERTLGRVKLIDKGPRNIDLDILLYDQERVDTDRLIVPHKLMSEREFVLRPLCQIAPDEAKPAVSAGGSRGNSFKSQLEELTKSAGPSKMSTFTPLSAEVDPLSPLSSSRRTHVMSILNITPDSFSDGGLHTDLNILAQTIQSHVASGATIIDIGGESTRPGATPVTPEEELSRILPVIKLCKDDMKIEAAISVDTYHASVAKAAVEAGADIVNDVGGGLLDPDMFNTVARLGCTYVLMHNRGTPRTMTSLENTTYKGDLIDVIASELMTRLHAAEEAGIRRWRIILDPGIGFAKTTSQHLELIRRFGELRARPEFEGIPWLVGVSRKGFIGKITGVKDAKERSWGTASAVTAAVMGGADIVRVHDVDEMVKVVKMSDAIWRPGR